MQSKKGPPQRVKDLLILEIAYTVYFEIETIVQSLLSPFMLNFSLSPAFAPYISRIAGAVTDIMFLSGLYLIVSLIVKQCKCYDRRR